MKKILASMALAASVFLICPQPQATAISNHNLQKAAAPASEVPDPTAGMPEKYNCDPKMLISGNPDIDPGMLIPAKPDIDPEILKQPQNGK